jgi:hypothetical protein
MRSITVSDDQSWHSIITDQYTAVKRYLWAVLTGEFKLVLRLCKYKLLYSAPSVYRPSPPRFIDNLANRQNSRLSRFPPLKIPCYTAKLSYRHRFIRHKSRKTNLNSPVSTAHKYLFTAVYWSVIMEFNKNVDIIWHYCIISQIKLHGFWKRSKDYIFMTTN